MFPLQLSPRIWRWLASHGYKVLVPTLFVLLSACGGGNGGDGGESIPKSGGGGGPTLAAITIAPDSTSVTVGFERAFTASGAYSDGSTADITSSVTWASSAPSVATISATSGLATGVAAGATTITATSGALSGSATLTVTAAAPVLSSITVTPADTRVVLERTRQFTATGTYSDGSTADITSSITWTSDVPLVAAIDATTGLATGIAVGTTTITATSGAVTGSAALTVTLGGAGNWSSPQALIGAASRGGGAASGGRGVASSDRAAYPDLNGNLQFTTKTPPGASNTQRAHRQFLKNDGTVTAAEVYPPFPSANPTFNDRGAPYDIVTGLDGTRMVIWGVFDDTALVMSWQSADGAFGPNKVSLFGVSPAAIAYRNGLVIVLSVSSGGRVRVGEWNVAPDGTLTALKTVELIDTETGCGGVVAIEADGSATALFQVTGFVSGQYTSQILSAQRSTAGVWALNPAAVDYSNTSVQSFGCLYGAASPSGRLLAAWPRIGAGDGSFMDRGDRGGEIKALLKEPGAALPSTLLSFHAALPDLVNGDKRRSYGINVAMGLDGTAGLIAKTNVCNNGGTLYFSGGLLRLVGPNQDFYTATNKVLTVMSSSVHEISPDGYSAPASAFAVENRRAIIGTSRVSYPDIGTDSKPSCGAGAQIFDPIVYTAQVTIYDDRLDKISVEVLGSVTRQVGQPDSQGSLPYRRFADAAVDFNGNFALVRGEYQAGLYDYLIKGNWQPTQ